MEKLQNFYQNSIKKVLNKLTESFRDKSNVNKIVDICALMFFSLAFLSIPLCSFKVGLNKITWIFSILFLLSGPLIFHSHRHVMFINYIPFLLQMQQKNRKINI